MSKGKITQASQRKQIHEKQIRNQKKAIKFVEEIYYSNCVNSVYLKEGKQGKCVILVDTQRTEIPCTHIDIGISLYDREVIADKYSSRFL